LHRPCSRKWWWVGDKISKKTDLSHKQEGISSGEEGGRKRGGEGQGRKRRAGEKEKSGALACRYASTQSPPPNLCQG